METRKENFSSSYSALVQVAQNFAVELVGQHDLKKREKKGTLLLGSCNELIRPITGLAKLLV